MSSRSALSVVEQQYGSLEELAYHILENKQDALDETLPLAQRAEMVGLPMLVFARILQDPMFRQILRADLVNSNYGLAEEEHHIKAMVRVAKNEPRTVVTNKGNLAEVDQMPMDIIAAGKYLNELRGTPVEAKRGSAFTGVTVNFENVSIVVGKAEDDRTITVETDVHRPSRAGDLPPAAIQGRGSASVPLPAATSKTDDAGLGTLYGAGAGDEDDAHTLPARREGEEGRKGPLVAEPVNNGKPLGKWPGLVRRKSSAANRRVEIQRPPYDD